MPSSDSHRPPAPAASARTAFLTIFGTLVAFKLITALYIISLQPTVQSAAFLTFTNVIWLVLVTGPLLVFATFWFRRLRGRAKRRRLIEQEWRVDAPRRRDLAI
jgi:hypothetical protein